MTMPISSSRINTLPPIKPSKSKQGAPFNLLQIHKKTLVIIDNVEKEIMLFGDLLMKQQRTTTDHIVRYMKFLENQLDLDVNINNVEVLNELLQHNKSTQCPEYYDLKLLVEKLLQINYLLAKVPVKINDIFENNLKPYCVSLIEEVGEKEVPPITKEYNEILEINRGKLNELIQRLHELKILEKFFKNQDGNSSIRDYIEKHDAVNQEMLKWGKIMLEICGLAKSWVETDRLYPEKLQDTIHWLRSKRHEITRKIHLLKQKQMDLEADRLELESVIQKRSCAVLQAHSDVGHYQARDRNVLVARKKVQNDIDKFKKARDICMVERSRSTSAKSMQEYNEQLLYYDNALDEANKRLKRLNLISNEFVAKQQNNSKSANQITADVSQSKQDYDRIQVDISNNQEEINTLLNIIGSIEDQILIVQNIKTLKIDDCNLIQSTSMYQPGIVKSYNDDLDDFFKLCSPVIGMKWKEVYNKLPFDPDRDWRQRDLDLETIDINNRRLEPDFTRLAYLSLQKWRRLSLQTATTLNLVNTLKKMGLAKFVLPLKNNSTLKMMSQR